jgi:hypothetical protein
MTPCNDVVGYQHFGRPCCLLLQGEDGGSIFLAMKISSLNSYTGSYIVMSAKTTAVMNNAYN